MTTSTPFHVTGIDLDDGSATPLSEHYSSGEALAWLRRYVSKENAGGWERIDVEDHRGECAETLYSWAGGDA